MDELILRDLEGLATDAERAELQRWRQAAPEHERRYQELRALWALTGMRAEIEDGPQRPAARDLLRPMPLGKAPRMPRRRRLYAGSTVAAAAAATVVVGMVALGRLAGVGETPELASVAVFRTGSSELETAVLADGTVARLGPNTTLRAVIGNQTREVRIDGRAFFAVTADPDRPFFVRAESGEVRVLGTRFELDARRDRVRLLVVDGEVALSTLGREAELRAGDLGEASAAEPLTVTRVEVPERLLDWMGAWVAFEATPLRQVATELEVRLGLRIELADPGLAERTITGWFSEEDRGQILTMVCRVAEVRCTESADRVLMDLP